MTYLVTLQMRPRRQALSLELEVRALRDLKAGVTCPADARVGAVATPRENRPPNVQPAAEVQ